MIQSVTLAVPCRADEPALGRTLEALLVAWRRVPNVTDLRCEVLVCVNGRDAVGSAAVAQFARCARDHGGEPIVVAASEARPDAADARATLRWRALLTPTAGKPHAWNVLRTTAMAEVIVFADADVMISPNAIAALLAALEAAPDAVLASPKTTCVAPATGFERVMATPYAIDFPNLSGQLYAARAARLPLAMPLALIEPERWLELVVGQEALVRDPRALVAVRVPGSVADFVRQRVRIEMGKVQMQRDYAALLATDRPQPRGRAALATLALDDLVRLGLYLVLRTACWVVAWWRFHRGDVDGVWRQPVSTKYQGPS